MDLRPPLTNAQTYKNMYTQILTHAKNISKFISIVTKEKSYTYNTEPIY